MKITTLAAALLASTALAGAAQAQSVAALVGDDAIAIVDISAKTVTRTMKLSGATGKLVGIDVRPADGMLYGVTGDGTIWTIDPAIRARPRRSSPAPIRIRSKAPRRPPFTTSTQRSARSSDNPRRRT